MMSRLLFLLLVSYLCSTVQAQNLEVDWFSAFQGEQMDLDIHTEMAFDAQGNAYAACSYADIEGYILKRSPEGEILWSAIYTNGIYVETRMLQLSDDAVFVGGIEEDGTGTFNMLLLKLDLEGNIEWTTVYDAGLTQFSHEEADEMELGPEGSVYLGGSAPFDGDLFQVAKILRYSSNGNLLWEKDLFEEIAFETSMLYSMKALANGDLLVLWAQENEQRLSLLNPQGVEVWRQELESFNHVDNAKNCIVEAEDGSIYLSGTRFSPQTLRDALIQKRSSEGSLIWEQVLSNGEFQWEQPMKMSLTSTGDLQVLISENANQYQLHLLSSDGESIWDVESSEDMIVSDMLSLEGKTYVLRKAIGGAAQLLVYQGASGEVLQELSLMLPDFQNTAFNCLSFDGDGNIGVIGAIPRPMDNARENVAFLIREESVGFPDFDLGDVIDISNPDSGGNGMSIWHNGQLYGANMRMHDVSGRLIYVGRVGFGTSPFESLQAGYYILSIRQQSIPVHISR